MAITYHESERIFMLQGKETTYAIQISPKDNVCNLHWVKVGKSSTSFSLPPQ